MSSEYDLILSYLVQAAKHLSEKRLPEIEKVHMWLRGFYSFQVPLAPGKSSVFLLYHILV